MNYKKAWEILKDESGYRITENRAGYKCDRISDLMAVIENRIRMGESTLPKIDEYFNYEIINFFDTSLINFLISFLGMLLFCVLVFSIIETHF